MALETPSRICIVEWLDSFYEENGPLRSPEELQEEDTDCRRFTIGFVMAEGPKTISLAMEAGDGGARHIMRIRKENIQSIKEIASAS
jgi:hypothetical protein